MAVVVSPQILRLRPWAGLAGGLVLFFVFLLVPAPEGLPAAGWRVAAVGGLMAVWWMTEALPLAVTALVPLVLFPPLGIARIDAAAAPFANPLVFLFMGGFFLALAMERWDLHRRLALSILRVVGTRPQALVAGFMAATAFLSMWVSNSATAMLMLPIGLSIVELVRRQAGEGGDGQAGAFGTVVMLTIAYASSIGGMATLVGTPPNALMAGFMAETYGYEVSFASWMALGGVLMLVALPVLYLILTRLFPIRLPGVAGGHRLIEDELRALGPMKRPEKVVAAVFAATAVLWIARPLLGDLVPGLSDAGIAMTAAVLLFAIPADARQGTFVLDWETARRMPWGVLLLFGGGFSLADAVQDTGLAGWIGAQMHLLAGWPVVLVVLAVVAVITLFSELASNTATAAAFLPIIASIAVGIGQDPMVLVVPATLAASCGFMLPVATPPNAIVFGSGLVSVRQMVRAGLVLDLVLIALVTVLAYLLTPLVFGPAAP